MKNLSKILCLILALAMVATVFAGCGESNPEDINFSDEVVTTTSTTVSGGGTTSQVTSGGGTKVTTSTTVKDKWDGAVIDPGIRNDIGDPTKYNIGGSQIILYGFSKPDASKSKTDAAHLKALEGLEKSMNCKIKYVESTADKTKQQTILNVMSNTHFADIVTGPQHGVIGYLTSDLLANLIEIKSMDLGQAYMNVGAGVEAFHLGSGYWAVNNPLNLATSGSYIYFNKRIMKEVTGDADHPYKLMAQKKWNISSFRDLNKKATKELDGNGKMNEKDQWGLIQCDIGTAGFSSILQANRALMIKNDKGTLVYNMEDGKCIPAINLGVEVYYKDNACYNTNDDGAVKLFSSGHGLFYGGSYAYTCSKLADMKDDFGILPYPMGDGQKEYSVCTNWNVGTFAIPASVPKKDNKLKNAGAFLQAYMYVAQDVVAAQFDEYSLRYCRDSQSKENLMIGYEAQYTTPSAAVANDDAVKMGTYRVCYDAASKAPATTVAANKSISIQAIKDLNEKLK